MVNSAWEKKPAERYCKTRPGRLSIRNRTMLLDVRFDRKIPMRHRVSGEMKTSLEFDSTHQHRHRLGPKGEMELVPGQ
jgi:hypothetical protein